MPTPDNWQAAFTAHAQVLNPLSSYPVHRGPAWVRGSAVIPAATAVERARADLTDDELAAAADPTGAP